MGMWTPTPIKLDFEDGLPFVYSNATISTISNTEAFNTGIDKRDKDCCIVCGYSDIDGLEHCHTFVGMLLNLR